MDPKYLTSFLETLKLLVGRRWPLIAFLFAIELVVVVYVASIPLSPSDLSTYETVYSSVSPIINASATGQVNAIFSNNFKVATVELIPALGLGVFGLSLYQTARIIQVIGILKGFGTGFALASLFAFPSTWLELPAYAIAATESVYLVYAFYLGLKRGRGRFFREIRFLFVNVILIAGVLVVAAVFEVSEIQIEAWAAVQAASGHPQYQAYALLTWIPFALVFAGVVVFWRRARRAAPELEAREAAETGRDAGGLQGVGEQGQPQQQGEKGAAGGPASSP